MGHVTRIEPVDSRRKQVPRAVRRVKASYPELPSSTVAGIVSMVVETITTKPCEKCDLPAVERRWKATNREGVSGSA